MGIDEPTTPEGVPTLRWLMHKARKGEITAEEFVKLSRQRGERERARILGASPGFVRVIQEQPTLKQRATQKDREK